MYPGTYWPKSPVYPMDISAIEPYVSAKETYVSYGHIGKRAQCIVWMCRPKSPMYPEDVSSKESHVSYGYIGKRALCILRMCRQKRPMYPMDISAKEPYVSYGYIGKRALCI